MEEIWLPIKGFEDSFYVSNTGKVKGICRVINRTNGRQYTAKEKLKTVTTDKYGYSVVFLSRDEKDYGKKLHRLIAEAFIPNLRSPNDYDNG